MKPPGKLLPLVFLSLFSAQSEAVLVYWIDADANTLTISGSATGTVTNSGVEWLFETGSNGDQGDFLSLVSGSFDPVVDTLAFSAAGETDAFFVGTEISNGPLTFTAENAVFGYGSLPSSVESFIEGSMMGNDIPLIDGDGFGDIVYIPEPGTSALSVLAIVGLFRRRR